MKIRFKVVNKGTAERNVERIKAFGFKASFDEAAYKISRANNFVEVEVEETDFFYELLVTEVLRYAGVVSVVNE